MADSPTPAATVEVTPSPTATATAAPTAPTTATAVPAPELSCAQRVLAEMSLQQRIGQLFLMGLGFNRLGATEVAAIQDHHIGSVWITRTTSIGVAGVRAVADAVQAQASPEATGGVRFFIAANQEGGWVQALRGTGFSTIPSALTQGAESADALAADAQRWGQELAAAGINLNYAPVFDVVPPGTDANNEPIGALQRAYGHDPLSVGTAATAFAMGMAAASVATSAKHFPGLGRVVGNTDYSAGVVDTVTTFDDPYLDAFRAGIDAGVPFVMVSLATYARIDPDHLAAFSSVVIGQLLRVELGFQGVVMSDDLGAAEAVAAIPVGDRAINFLLAGGDLIVSRMASATMVMATAVAVRSATDPIMAARVHGAALRILEAKEAAGLLTC